MEQRFKNIAGIVRSIGMELEAIDIERGKENRITVTITKSEGAITAYDCSRVSRLIDPILESEKIFGNESYLLVVSSPGK